MPSIGPIKRRDLIRNLRKVGFQGPFVGGRHQFMKRGTFKLIIPNPHRGDISVPLLRSILAEAGVSEDE